MNGNKGYDVTMDMCTSCVGATKDATTTCEGWTTKDATTMCEGWTTKDVMTV